ncbi:MAG TPA: ATP-binding protein [Cellulomonas sp.]|uniref:sensor histidine kinase n=1 Tax=Cellulomonas sp. TaxID=40001 RepID=UPI002E36773B|nr:ATP-binding protein [Cellulomonas sp.]HEX5333438.1 ATP-binding protein [Cellulomonas sp.]
MRTRVDPRRWSVAWQVFTLQLIVVAVVLLAGVAAAYLQARENSQEASRSRVLAVARAVAASPQVRAALTTPDPSTVLQPLAEQVRHDTATDFVVVMGTDRTRYSHPNASLIGQPFIGHIDAALAGGVVLETYTGTLGPSERAVVPVRSEGGSVVGLVSVGVTRGTVSRDLAQQVPRLLGAGAVALILAAFGAVLVARRLRRQTHGLGPDELGRMYEFYDAVLHAVREGLVLLDLQGRLVLANDEACRLLDLGPDWEGRRLDELGLPAPMTASLAGGTRVQDAIQLTTNRVLVVNQAPARWEGRELGTVLTLRDHTDLQALTGELNSARGLTEALRSQAHEAANRLHSVISLIELGRTDQALDFATVELAAAQRLTDLVVGAVDEPVLAALLLGKAAEANERGVELEVDPATSVPEGMLPARDMVTVVGNLLDNAIDAAASVPGLRRVRFSGWVEDSRSEGGIASVVVLQVSDTGPGLDDETAALAFTRGWSTKTDQRLVGHGLGLALVGQTAHRHHGTVEVRGTGDDPYLGAVFTVRLPIAVEVVR